MPFERDIVSGKVHFSFPNLLAYTLSLACIVYLFWVSFAFTKAEAKENTTVIQIISAIIVILTTVINYYFGNSKNSQAQAQQITEMQKTATTLALNNKATSADVINTENISGDVTAETVNTTK